MINHDIIKQFNNKLQEIGIVEGDTIQFSIDLSRLLMLAMREYGYTGVEGRDEFLYEITDCIKNSVGKDGTILVPSFTWMFNEGKIYRRKDTPSEVGSYSNWLLKKGCDFVRTRHPIHSFLVWGKDQNYYTSLNNVDSWGEDSPFAHFANSSAKLVVCDMPTLHALTIFHYVEERLEVPYKYTKSFKGYYIDYDGKESERVITMYVRDLDLVPEWYFAFEEDFFRSMNSAKYASFGDISFACFAFRDIVRSISDDLIRNNGKNCIKIEGYSFDLNGPRTHEDDLAASL